MSDNERTATADNNLANDKLEHKKQRIVVAGSIYQRLAIIKAISQNSYEFVETDTARDLLAILNQEKYDLVITSTNLPDHDSMQLMRSISKVGESFGILAHSDTDDEIDRVLALELGADDCVPLSCGSRELKARVRALLRRRSKDTTRAIETYSKSDNAIGSDLSYRGWTVNKDRCQLYSPTGIAIPVTNAECGVLVSLFSNPGIIRDRLSLRNIGAYSKEFDPRSLDVSISRLRKKMARYGGHGIIETVRGRGYRLITVPPCTE
ncbi:response regulator transcription factor [Sphingomonas sp. CFBP 13706]|jgi:DNA-binding response OmpR family regulator|uniref:response regulator transcription factor n=1 Tax=Sphingomonas sp. CFBP 13706 TaxID=2775314 RepID=UPI00178013A1|nr:response regulator transcription factor [Sphingomonas sp. CFBP 13706]MBD8737421.1 response regulator transcription factor [Sphingomonas sp. CFBP 13706]